MNNEIDIEQIKRDYSILDIASKYGANPYGRGNTVSTKFNPLRTERTSSLKLYRDTNSWADFGGGQNLGGSVIDFVMVVENVDFKTAIEKITG